MQVIGPEDDAQAPPVAFDKSHWVDAAVGQTTWPMLPNTTSQFAAVPFDATVTLGDLLALSFCRMKGAFAVTYCDTVAGMAAPQEPDGSLVVWLPRLITQFAFPVDIAQPLSSVVVNWKRTVVLRRTASMRACCKPFCIDSAVLRICMFCIQLAKEGIASASKKARMDMPTRSSTRVTPRKCLR